MFGDLHGPERWAAIDDLVAQINDRTGSGLCAVGVADRGESGGAAYVRWPDGRHGVVTRAQESLDRMLLTADVLSLARSRGLPVPRHDLVVALAGGTLVVVQERLPGAPARRVDAATVDAMVEMNDRFAGVLSGRADVPAPELFHRVRDYRAFHETLDGHSARARRVLRQVRDIARWFDHEVVGDDLVHLDYTLGNVLYDDSGLISGVVDWNLGAARGDRRFALVKLRIDLSWDYSTYVNTPELAGYQIEPEAIERMDQILASKLGSSPTAHTYWAHWILQHLHWAIVHRVPDTTVDIFLGLAEKNLK